MYTNWDTGQYFQVVARLLKRLEIKVTVNPLRCEWDIKETAYSGFLLTAKAIKPMSTKCSLSLKSKDPHQSNMSGPL